MQSIYPGLRYAVKCKSPVWASDDAVYMLSQNIQKVSVHTFCVLRKNLIQLKKSIVRNSLDNFVLVM